MVNVGNRRKGFVVTATIAAILLTASLAIARPSNASDEGAEIRATGPLSSTVIGNIAQHTVGDLQITTRHIMNTYGGDIQGYHIAHQTLTSDLVNKKDQASARVTFKGTIGGKSGAFTGIVTATFDRTACPCPPGTFTFDSTMVVVEGSGLGELKDICGGGTIKGSGPPAVSTYDFTFRFGKDCKSNR